MQKKSPEELETFLHWFRKVRITPKSKIRWLIAGSVNIEGTLAQLGQIKTINDLEKEILPPFTEEEVGHFVTQMLEQRDVLFDPQIISQIKNLLGSPIPVFLQLFTQELYRYWRRAGRKKIEKDHVSHVFEKSLLGEKPGTNFSITEQESNFTIMKKIKTERIKYWIIYLSRKMDYPGISSF